MDKHSTCLPKCILTIRVSFIVITISVIMNQEGGSVFMLWKIQLSHLRFTVWFWSDLFFIMLSVFFFFLQHLLYYSLWQFRKKLKNKKQSFTSFSKFIIKRRWNGLMITLRLWRENVQRNRPINWIYPAETLKRNQKKSERALLVI